MMMDENERKIEFWAQQAMMWHDKYKSVLAIEDDYHRYRVALERIATANHATTKEWVRACAKRALKGDTC